MAVIAVYAYNGPAMSPWHHGFLRPSSPPDDTIAVLVPELATWVRSYRGTWMSEWHELDWIPVVR